MAAHAIMSKSGVCVARPPRQAIPSPATFAMRLIGMSQMMIAKRASSGHWPP